MKNMLTGPVGKQTTKPKKVKKTKTPKVKAVPKMTKVKGMK